MKKKLKVLLTSALTLLTCACTIAGSTFALFTSESKVNVAVTSGSVAVSATVQSLTTYSMDYETPYDSITQAGDAQFENGGYATWSADGNSIALNNITPGDKAELILLVENKSTVDILFKAVLENDQTVDNENKLFDELEVYYYSCDPTATAGEEEWEMLGGNRWGEIFSFDSTWKTLAAPASEGEQAVNKIKIEIELPEYVDNEYQNAQAFMVYSVEALQGNAPIPADEVRQTEDGLYISGDGTLLSMTEEQQATVTDVVVPEGVTTISNSVFRRCENLKTVELPSSVTTVQNEAFYHVTTLEEVDLSKTTITNFSGIQMFSGCTSLKTVKLPETLTEINGSAFVNCTSLTNIDLPENLETIGGSAFYSSGLTEVLIPASVTTIGGSAFSSCANLTKIEFEDENATVKIGGYFGGFSQVKEIVLPKNATISEHTFRNNSALEKVVFKGVLNTIPDFAFSGCKSLKTIVLEQNTQMPTVAQNKSLSQYGTNAFLSASSAITLVMPNYTGNEGDTMTVGYDAEISGTVYNRWTTLTVTKIYE